MPVMEGNGETEGNVLRGKVLLLLGHLRSFLARPSDFEICEWWKFALAGFPICLTGSLTGCYC